jgi:hypothetical protein
MVNYLYGTIVPNLPRTLQYYKVQTPDGLLSFFESLFQAYLLKRFRTFHDL